MHRWCKEVDVKFGVRVRSLKEGPRLSVVDCWRRQRASSELGGGPTGTDSVPPRPWVHTEACRDWRPRSWRCTLAALWAYVVSRLPPCGFPRTLQCVRVFNSERICRKPFKRKWWTKTQEEEPTGRERAGAQAAAWASPGDLWLLWDFPLVSGTEENISTLNWLALNLLTFAPKHGQCGPMRSCRMWTWPGKKMANRKHR